MSALLFVAQTNEIVSSYGLSLTSCLHLLPECLCKRQLILLLPSPPLTLSPGILPKSILLCSLKGRLAACRRRCA